MCLKSPIWFRPCEARICWIRLVVLGRGSVAGCGLMDEGCNCAKECGVSILCFCADCLSSAIEEAVSISLRTWNALKSCIFVLL